MKRIKFAGLPDDTIVVIYIKMQVFHGIFPTCPKYRQPQTAGETRFVVYTATVACSISNDKAAAYLQDNLIINFINVLTLINTVRHVACRLNCCARTFS